MSWRIASKCGAPNSAGRWSLRPVNYLSTHKTSSPWARSRSHRCEPKNPAPPVTRTRLATTLMAGLSRQGPQRRRRAVCRAADAQIGETGGRHLLGLVDVAQIDHQRARQGALDAAEIEPAELVPLGQQHQCRGPLHRLIGVMAAAPIGHQLLRLAHSFGVESADARSGGEKARQDGEARGVAHVVGVGLEGQDQDGQGLAGQRAAARGDDLVGHPPLARLVHRDRRFDDRQGGLGLARGAHQCGAVLGEARAAKARPGMEKLAADAAVEPDAAGDVLDIAAQGLAQIGDLVDEGDLGGEKGVGRVFDQLGGLDAGEHDRRLNQIERPIELAQHRPRPLAVGADHHPVGAHEIGDRRALAQKLRIGSDIKAVGRPGAAQDLGDLAAGADRHGRFGHHHRIARQRPADRLGGGIDIGQIGMPVAAPRRRADGDEHRLGAGHRRRQIGSEKEPPRRHIGRHQRPQPGLENRHLAALQPGNLRRVLVDAGDRRPKLRKTRPRDQTHIPGPDHRYPHPNTCPIRNPNAAQNGEIVSLFRREKRQWVCYAAAGNSLEQQARMPQSVLVTGGAGYIGSHACKILAKAGHQPIVFDNLSRGHREAVRWGPLVEGDLADRERLVRAMRAQRASAVMHFAAFAYVGESVADPALYYRNNLAGTLSLLEAMRQAGVDKIVFSSTCATYGLPDVNPIRETAPQLPVNPYGETKLAIERALRWYGEAYRIRSVSLRYFNAAGADSDGEIGECHKPETHLIPLVLQAALGQRSHVEIYGVDYPTADGTGIRDYIHVEDLADAHLRALEQLYAGCESAALNLGVGRGHSVREVITAAEAVSGRAVPWRNGARRAGDPPVLVADPSLAAERLAWRAQRSDLPTIIRTALAWHQSRAR